MKLIKILAICFFILSCNTDKKYNRYMDGDWKIVTLKVTEINGIGDYVTTLGKMSFSHEKKSKKGSYNFDLSYVYQNNNYSIVETGSYIIKDQEMVLTNTSGIETPASINYVNKSDLEFILPNWNNKNLYFLMKKIE